MQIYFVRHLKTKENFNKAYIGRVDSDLYDVENQQIVTLPDNLTKIYSSPMKRCLYTAKIAYPNINPIIAENLKEIDFGDFECKTYNQLCGNKEYRDFIDGVDFIPNGEKPSEFKKRCLSAFLELTDNCNESDTLAIFCHGGTIMSILFALDEDKSDYYSYQIKNGEAYLTDYSKEKKTIKIVKKIENV